MAAVHCGASGVIWQMSIPPPAAAAGVTGVAGGARLIAALRAAARTPGRVDGDRRPRRPAAAACRPRAPRPEAAPHCRPWASSSARYAACGSSTKAAASRSHLRACFIATPSASFEALSSRRVRWCGAACRFHYDASCLNSENCWGIRLTAKESATISAQFRLSNGNCWRSLQRAQAARDSSSPLPNRASTKSSASNSRRSSARSPRPTYRTGTPSSSQMPRTMPPLAVPSSFVRTMPVEVERLLEHRGLRQRVLPGRRVEHEKRLVRRAVERLGDGLADLLDLVHQRRLGVQATRRVDEQDVGSALFGVRSSRRKRPRPGRRLPCRERPRLRRACPRPRAAARPRRGRCRPRPGRPSCRLRCSASRACRWSSSSRRR